MEKTYISGEEVVMYTLEEFIRATRPDGLGHIYVNGEHVAEFEEVICDWCNVDITQPEKEPGTSVVFLTMNRAWCRECFERWAE
jgi:hypothetical protein